MNQDQQFLVNNLQKMIKYIQQETDKKVQMIKKEKKYITYNEPNLLKKLISPIIFNIFLN